MKALKKEFRNEEMKTERVNFFEEVD